MSKLMSGLMLVCLAASAMAAESARLELRNERLTVALGQAEQGAIISLRANGGEELAVIPRTPLLFALTLSKKSAPNGEKISVTSHDAKNFHVAAQPQGLTLSYAGFANCPALVTCTARTAANDPHIRWRIAVQVPEGFVLEAVRFPIVTLRAPLGAGTDDAAVLGSTKGGLIRNPAAMRTGSSVSIAQPGNMAAQFGCLYNARGGFFTAALDGRGYPKHLIASRAKEGIEFSWYRPCFATGSVTQDYDAVMTTFAGASGAPCDWRDAADLYKSWALTQPWCVTTYERRTDIPAWMKDGPAMVRFSREWLAEPARIERWMAEYWQKKFPAAPLIMAFWGWEKIGNWVTPDYFPLYPNDAQFTQLVAHVRAAGAHAFPWPSGYHWTLTYQKRSDGSFEWDDRKHFDEVARTHAIQTRDGKLYLRTPSWLRGGDTTCMCGGDPWTLRWWNEDICVPLARRGCEMIQVDQVVGGGYPACFDRAHPHPAGPGLWQTENFTRQLQTMYATLKKIEPDAVVCFEEPNERFNHLVGIQDYRDCEAPHEWASVFNYLYHEFLPPFQSNPRGSDLLTLAHCLVDGQLPHMVPTGRDLAEPVLVNGGFEPRAGRNEPLGWEQVHSYLGVQWTGKASNDTAEKHGGAGSLRLDNVEKSDFVQVSQNVSVGPDALAVGKKYRLTAWLKTGHMAKPNAIGYCFLSSATKSFGHGGALPFPAAGAGWQKISSDFTVPENAERLRIMINLAGVAQAWADDMTVEEILPGGGTQPVIFSGAAPAAQLMQRWVALYHGEGRPWLEHGRMLHPPKLTCATQVYEALSRGKNETVVRTPRNLPVVFHNAFRAADGSEAVVLANTTLAPQHVTLEWHGQPRELDVPPADALLVK